MLDAAGIIGWFWLVATLRNLAIPFADLLSPILLPFLIQSVALYLIDGYQRRTDMLGAEYVSLHALAILTSMVVVVLLTFVIIPAGYPLQGSRLLVVAAFAGHGITSLLCRRRLYLATYRSYARRKIVFVGSPKEGHDFETECARMELHLPIWTISPQESPEAIAKLIAAGREENSPIEAVVLRETAQSLRAEDLESLVDLYFHGVPTFTLEFFHEIYWRKVPLYRLNQIWLFQAGFRVAREPVFERTKRGSDIGLALLGIAFAAPFVGLAAIAIWLQDRGPIFFRQQRIGRNRRPFSLLKLRTMRVAPPTPVADRDQRYTQPGDRRITAVGRLLRATRVDEFPQLWNVLKGDMSLIGPRAEWDELVRDYESAIPCYHFRHLVRPGITGWAQVNYPYGANLDDTLRKLEYDLYYIRHYSFRMDASIILKTIHVMLFGKGR